MLFNMLDSQNTICTQTLADFENVDRIRAAGFMEKEVA